MAEDLTSAGPGGRVAPGAEIVAPLSTRSLFWRARYLRESPFLVHVPFLFWLIETARPSSVVTLGLGDGVGHFAACQALARSEQGAEAVAVEPGHSGDADAVAEWERLSRYNEDNYSEFSTLMQGDLRGTAHRFPDGAIDLLLVNADADEGLIEALSHDWPRKLSERAVVLFHGSRSGFADGAAAGFMGRVEASYPTACFEAREGLLLVLYGPNRQDRLLRLTELRPGVRGFAEIHHAFRRLGAAHEFECANRERTAAEEKLEARLHAAEEERTRLEAEVERLRGQLSERNQASGTAVASRESERLLEALRGVRAELDARESELAEANAKVQRYVDEAKAREAELAEAERRIAELRAGESEAHVTELTKLTETIERIEEERLTDADAAKAELAALKAELATVRAHRDALLASTSWRITAPLRGIVRATRGR